MRNVRSEGGRGPFTGGDGSSQSSRTIRSAGAAATIERLAAPVLIDSLSCNAIRTVLSFRILALCSKAGREPLVELSHRMRSVSAAKAFLAWAETVGRCWPENIHLCRPCCRVLSHDEITLAKLIDSAARRDREAFGRIIDGLVRDRRHDALYTTAVVAVGEMDALNWRGPVL